ncbi:hypothetical protein EUX98_g536 [Antrodiella citrinella]|uniref:Nucleoporin NSP1 n=1 Tax=Antrodiella citrinella TaxID=2447956 RepID=A0A4S4N3J8_9APHY|nr:hypothetical protein EUX98_g536 [Antrodiella citrinella]
MDPNNDQAAPSGRRQVVVINDSDIIVAAGSEIRIASLGDAKLHRGAGQSHKILHTPNVTFEVHTMVLNPNAKILAVAGAFQVAVVVLPRPGFTRLVPTTIDCKSIQIGQYYHASKDSAPIAKIEWHPWGDGGTTLMIMTTDGKMREYDISQDTEEPQQVVSFVPEKKSKSYLAEDSAEREVASFTLGKGKADWGPLTLYALMKSGDIYSISPYMPKNACIPTSYIHALECFVHAKKEFLSRSVLGASSSTSLSTLYEYQHKYVSALLRQLPPGTAFPATSRPVPVHPPTTIKAKPIRQGPFLLQPAPRMLEGSEGADASDILYVAFGGDEEDEESDTERLGVVLVAFQDGKVDVCLDVEKIEAKWEHRQHSGNDLPVLAVYETIDLGTVSMLRKASSSSGPQAINLLQGSHPVFFRDPIQDETIYIYHAFGVHALHLAPLLQTLTAALRDDNSNEGDDEQLRIALERASSTLVQPMLTTYSVERRSCNPVIGVAIPKDVYLTYSIFILTSAMRLIVFPLSLHSDPPPIIPQESLRKSTSSVARPQAESQDPPEPPLYISLLEKEPFVPDTILTRPLGARLALPQSGQEFQLTPDTLRFLATRFGIFMDQSKELHLAFHTTNLRATMQHQEFRRQVAKGHEIVQLADELSSLRQAQTVEKIQRIQDTQKDLLDRMEKILRVLMKTASPELSEHETKWFEELKRMKLEVKGANRYDESLENRTNTLRRELDRMLPNLKELHEKEEQVRKKVADHQQSLGVAQAFELGERSNAEYVFLILHSQQLQMFPNSNNQSTPPTGNIFGNNSSGTIGGSSNIFGGSTFGAPAQPATGGSSAGPSGGLFGNTNTAPNTNLFGSAPQPSTSTGFGAPAAGGGLFANANQGTTTPSGSSGTPAGAGGGLFGNLGSTAPAASSGFSLPSGGIFGPPKPTEQTTATPSSAFGQSGTIPAGGLFANLPPKPSEATTAAAAAAASTPSGGLFSASTTATPGGGLFGTKPADVTSSGAPPAGGLFGTKPDAAGTSTNSGPALPTLPPFSLGGTSSTTPGASSTPNLFGKKPEEKKDAAAPAPAGGLFDLSKDAAGEKKDVAAPAAPSLFSSATAAGKAPAAPATAPTGPSATAPPAAAVVVPLPNALKGKSIEEIVNKWTNELEVHVREFSKFASEVAVWDRALVENSNNLAALYGAVLAAEREQNDIDQSLDYIEQQQRDLSSTLEQYEKATEQILGGQGGNLRALDTGPADTERDKNYTLATELHGNLDDLSASLVQMIDSVNALSTPSTEAAKKNTGEDPMSQISQILSSHLESLQWIDGAVREVEGKVVDIEKRVRGAGESSNSSGNASKSRGYGLGR